MLEPSGRPDLAQETLRTEGGTEVGVEDLEGDRAVVLEVVREIDSRHPAPAELALQPVAVGQPGAKRGRKVRQSFPPLSAHELPEHALQDAAVPVVVELHRGVEPHDRGEDGLLARSRPAPSRSRVRPGASPFAMPEMENVSRR